jgi:hypothetical protein
MTYLKKFDSQIVEVFPESGLIKTHIREAFHIAGKQYGWAGNPIGIGIAEEIVEFAAADNMDICVTVGDNPTIFCMNSRHWTELAKKFNSYYPIGDKKLVVVPWSEMKRV